jgi:hypothetical protein
MIDSFTRHIIPGSQFSLGCQISLKMLLQCFITFIVSSEKSHLWSFSCILLYLLLRFSLYHWLWAVWLCCFIVVLIIFLSLEVYWTFWISEFRIFRKLRNFLTIIVSSKILFTPPPFLALYHLSHCSSPLCLGYFRDGILRTICPAGPEPWSFHPQPVSS